MISVLHNSKFLDFALLFDDNSLKEKAKQINASEDLLLVAEVETDSLDDAYRLTNHIGDSWQNNKEVKAFLDTRSTSVGDIMLHNGKKYIVAVCGFVEI